MPTPSSPKPKSSARGCLIFTFTLAAVGGPSALGGNIVIWDAADGGNGHAYQLESSAPIRWHDADELAFASFYEGTQGHLATITSAQENAFVISLLTDQHAVWLGGLQHPETSPPTENWQWVTGEPWLYTNWNDGAPDDAQGVSELFLGMWGPNGPAGALGRWNDFASLIQPGAWPDGFIIEYDIPAPATLWGVCGVLALGRRRRHSAY